MKKPYLTSVGIALPSWGVSGHRYFATRRRYALHSRKVLGISVVIASYKRAEDF